MLLLIPCRFTRSRRNEQDDRNSVFNELGCLRKSEIGCNHIMDGLGVLTGPDGCPEVEIIERVFTGQVSWVLPPIWMVSIEKVEKWSDSGWWIPIALRTLGDPHLCGTHFGGV